MPVATYQTITTTINLSESTTVSIPRPTTVSFSTAPTITLSTSTSLSAPSTREPIPFGLPSMATTTQWVDFTVTVPKTTVHVMQSVTAATPPRSTQSSENHAPAAVSTRTGLFSFDPTTSVDKGIDNPPSTTGQPWTNDASVIAASASAVVSSQNAAASSVASVASSDASSALGSLMASATSTSGAMPSHDVIGSLGGTAVLVACFVAMLTGERILRARS